ncbi:large ribosomal subunit protein uL30m-like [Ptychodera flava]|uniref:large ribosomal subunit protein uL30m-like n=1 Tax=Ptychodera flava TaxID=63121 RepID=UPI003969CC56
MAATTLCGATARMLQNMSLRSLPVRTCFYIPRHKGQVRANPKPLEVDVKEGDAPPHMLHAVYRTNSTRKRPYWEKEIIEQLGLDVMHKVVILKNIPSVNEKLQAVKHLIRIQPVQLQHGLPQDGDYDNTLLKHNGEFVLTRKVNTVERTESVSEMTDTAATQNKESTETPS